MLFHCWIGLLFGFAIETSSHSIGDDNSTVTGFQYSVLGSQFIRPNSKYFVSVNLHKAPKPVAFQVSIQNQPDNPNFLLSKNVILEPFTSRTIEFETGQMTPLQSNYLLVAEGLSGLIFRNETTLWLNEKIVSIHLQTDRPEYAVGDTLKFRVIILDIDAIPVTVSNRLGVFLKVLFKICKLFRIMIVI